MINWEVTHLPIMFLLSLIISLSYSLILFKWCLYLRLTMLSLSSHFASCLNKSFFLKHNNTRSNRAFRLLDSYGWRVDAKFDTSQAKPGGIWVPLDFKNVLVVLERQSQVIIVVNYFHICLVLLRKHDWFRRAYALLRLRCGCKGWGDVVVRPISKRDFIKSH